MKQISIGIRSLDSYLVQWSNGVAYRVFLNSEKGNYTAAYVGYSFHPRNCRTIEN